MIRRFAAAFALLILSMSVLVPTVEAKVCLEEVTAELLDDYRVVLSAKGPLTHIEFMGMENMLVALPGERLTRVEDFDWRLPANTREAGFNAKHYNPSKDMLVVLIIYDECEQGFLLPLLAYPTVIIDPYPFPPYDKPRARMIAPSPPVQAPVQLPRPKH